MGSEPLPSYAAVTGRKRTTELTRKYTGSCRLPGAVEAQTQPGSQANFLNQADWILWQQAWNNIAGADLIIPGGNRIRMGVFSLKDMAANNPPGVVADPSLYWRRNQITQVNVYLGSQVSRKYGSGI